MQATIHGVAKSGARLSDFTFFLSLVAQTVKNLPTIWEIWVQSLGWEEIHFKTHIIKMLKVKDKERIVEAARKKKLHKR